MSGINLVKWLDVATNGLTGESTGRVEREVTAHYRDLVAAEVAQGSTKEEAREQAIQSLGSPKAARRLYQRSYLTIRDEYRLNMLALTASHRSEALFRLTVLGCLFVSYVTATVLFRHGQFAPVDVLADGVMAWYLWAKARTVPALLRAGHVRSGFVLACVVETLFWTVFPSAPSGYASLDNAYLVGGVVDYWSAVASIMFPFLLFFALFKLYRNLPLFLKLRARENTGPVGTV